MKVIPSLLIGCLVFLCACKKEIDSVVPGPVNSKDSIYISMYAELDTTLPTGRDTLYKYTFAYDSRKRIREMKEYDYNNATSRMEISYAETYFYNGNDTLANKVALSYFNSSGNIDGTDTSYLKYTGAFIKQDSILTYSGGALVDMETFTYNLINPSRCVITGSDLFDDSVVVNRTVVNNNITRGVYNFYNGGAITDMFSYDASFDSKPNPFFRVSLHYPVASPFAITYFNAEQRNNMVDLKLTDGGPLVHYRYNYSYRSDGYPLIVRVTSVNDPSDFFKGVYKYTLL